MEKFFNANFDSNTENIISIVLSHFGSLLITNHGDKIKGSEYISMKKKNFFNTRKYKFKKLFWFRFRVIC